ncbi:T9SS type B sorting domain-containing protein [Flavobacterium dankookense]|uniref:T9SS type B sorting domain-containing protein n=1 Tax=Flavobacterium dankookense TaxID=706186 RepID=UPI003CCC54BE
MVYNQTNIENKQLNVYDGFSIAFDQFNNGITPFAINNLNVVAVNDAKITYIAYNGSPNLFFNESITFNGNILSNSLNPSNNPFNGTNSFTGSNTNWNQDIDTFDVSTSINIGDTEAELILSSFSFRSIPTLITSIRSELPDATVSINQVTGQEVCGNRNLVVTYTVFNTNSNAALPSNVPVSFYVNNTLIETINTTSAIAIGGSLNLQNTISIPASFGNNFTLQILVDNSAVIASSVAESNEGNNTSNTQNITLSTALVTPIFAGVNPICSGATLSALPTISTNGISGTWSPALNNLQTTVYTFTPNAGQCASSNSLTITVNPSVTTTFSAVNPICSGATLSALPTISTNGISGTWSPALNNLQTTVYTFTPNAGQCASSTTFTITVNSLVTPTFTAVNPICSGETLSALPTISTNGISGSWSPALNNLQTTEYTFGPTTGQCASSTRLTIEIVPNLQPDFSAISLCENDTSFSLNSISPNGIVGSWLPSIVDSTTSGFYTFTPNSGQCANNQTIEITINPITLQDFEVEVSHPFSTNATITVIINSIGNYSFQLDDGSIQSSNIFQNVTSGIHSVTVYQNDGCAISITKNDILIIHYPLFFTPNGDGFNDTWTISDLFLQPNVPIYIFDRYGKLLKQISTIGNGWDGTYNGQNMPSDSYWFTVDYQFNSTSKKFSAAFALKR